MAILFMDSPYAWDYTVRHKDNIGGAFKGRVMRYPRGFSLGGSRFVDDGINLWLRPLQRLTM